MKICKGCGVDLTGTKGPRKYCSQNCGVPEKSCVECGETFTPDRYYQSRKTCSDRCKNIAMARRNRTTQRVNKPGGLTRSERDKIAESRRAQRRGTGYLKVDGRHEHLVIAEMVLGRALSQGEVVHHEDANKMNNDPENLIVFPSQAVHARHHKLKHLGRPCDCPGIRLREVMS